MPLRKAVSEEVRRLGDHERWHDVPQILSFERRDTRAVVLVVCVGSRVQRSGVNDRERGHRTLA